MGKEQKAQSAIELNNQLRKELSDENEKYYSDLLVYVRTAGLFFAEEKVEQLLIEILQDILTAQKAGMSAQEYFGHKPKEAADQLIATFPKATFEEKFKISGMVFGISTLTTFITQINSMTNQLNLLPFFLNGLLTMLFVQLFFLGVHHSIYLKLPKNKVLNFLLLWLLGMIVLGSFIGIQFIKPIFFTISLPTVVVSSIIILFILGLTAVTVLGKKSWRGFLVALLPMAWINGGFYLFNIVNSQIHILSVVNLKLLTAVGSIIGLIWFYIMLLRESRKEA